MKRVLIGILVFVLYMALVIVGAIALHFEGTKLILFCVILGLLGALTIAFVVWYLHKVSGGSSGSLGPETPDAINLSTLLRDADAKVRQANRSGAKSLAALPLIYVIGDENSAKTQTVLQSGLDPELIAGNVYRDGLVVPTQLANLWLAGNYVLVEAGGALLRQGPLWLRLVRATIPARLGSVFGDSRLPARSVVVCVSIERILAPNTSEQIRVLAQGLNERLRQLSQTLGISLPIYVLFTKLDNITPFAEYVSRLSDEEVKLPIGSLLSSLSTGAGLYTEQATALIGARFDQLIYALGEFRIDILSRGGELQSLARSYEFPRDLRKVRAGIVSFLAEIARPSQIGVNPFLRGFFFAGMRAHVVEDVLEVGLVQPQAAAPVNAGATRIFSLASLQQPDQVPQSRRGGTRKVAQWVFLPHLFSKILLADESALETSRASTRTSFLKRALLATASVIILIVFSLITISFFKNRALEERLAKAAAAPVSPVSSGTSAAVGDLESLDKLRAVVAELEGYRKDGPPVMARLGLYKGDALYPLACQAYANKFRTLLLAPTQENILGKLRAVPATPAPDSDYGATYRPLKAYLITASNPDPDTAQDTVDFLPAALLTEWAGNNTPDPNLSQLAQTQFQFYANLLPGQSSCMANAAGGKNDVVIAHARFYLNGFQGFQHVYQSMLAAANHKVPGLSFNDKFPGSSQYIFDNYPVQGAFTKGGFAFMQDAILHPDPYFRGEEWVLGPSSGPPIDRAALSVQLKAAYVADYIQTWRTYLTKAQFIPYKNFADAGIKLGALDSNTSAMLELFALISVNTGVASTDISSAFQAPQSVVPPSSPDNRFIAQTNQAYIQSLQGLEGSVKTLSLNPTSANDPTAAMPVVQAALMAEQATETLRNGFVPDSAGLDKTSFTLLEAPIESAKNLAAQAPANAAGGGAKAFCAQIGPLLAKFPFNPQSTTEASTDEVAQVFAPGTGSFAQFGSSLKALAVLQGSQYVPAPGSTVHISPAFLGFLSNSQRISSTLFPGGGNQPSLDFTLSEVKTPGVSEAVLNIDGKQISAGGQSATFHWVSQPSSKITLATQKNTAPVMTGPWSVFHLGFSAPQVSPNRLKFSFSFNNQAPEIVLFDASGPGAPLLNPEFMKGFHCVSNVAR
ncbi:MAG: ImcF-related family protein [Terracidiphilus sp.]|jgi:type VI secretion system protein ImpL